MNSNKLCIVACFTILTCVSHANEVIRNVQFNMKIVGNWTVLNFTCLLYRRPIGDAVLIQINSSTVDVIRYKNNTCYDRDKECQNDTCFCSDDGHTFKIVYWYKKPKASRSYNFGIETLLNDSKANIVTVTLSRFYNGQGFEKLQIVKETSRYNFMETIDQTDNSLKNACSKLQTNSLALSATNGKNVWIALPTSMLIVFYLLCICLYHAFDLWRNRKHSRLKSLDTTGETYSMFKATDNVSITIVSTAVDIRNVDNKLLENPSFESSSEEMPMLHQRSKMQSHSSNSKDEICLPFIPGSSNEEEQMRCSALDEQFVPTCILGQMVHGIRSNVIPKKICGALQFASVPTMGIELMYSDCICQWMYPTQFHYDKNEEKIKPRFNISYLIDDQEPPVGIDCTWKDVVSYEAEEGKTPYMLIQDNSFNFQHPDDRKEIERQLKILKEFEEYWKLGLPIEIKQLDKKSAKVFASLLEEEGYEHYEARVMSAGEQETGKTTIARYLVGKGPTRTRISTDGIQLYNRLSFIDRENEEWLHGKQDFTLSEVAISRSLRTDPSTSINVKEKEKTTNQDTSIHKSVSCPTLNTESISSSHITDTQQTSPDRLNENPTQKPDLCVPAKEKKEYVHTGTDTKASESSITSEVVKNPGLIGMLKKLFGIKKHVEEIKVSMTDEKSLQESLKVGRKKIHHRKIVPVIIWDFGGQDVFYSTHQTFLTYRAIYLIVLDGHRNLDDPCPFEQYLPGKSGPKTARDYLRFWITTIVTYCKGSRTGFPKIIIVLTHKDKLKVVDVEPKRQQLFHEIEQMFSGSTLLSHLAIKDQIFVNARNAKDPEMSKIKNIITEQAIEQPTWGQQLPKCFIPLELEFDSLLRRNIPLITMDHMQRINSAQPVRLLTDVELKTFLKLQHSVGRILYFDEASLNQHIILSPTHLIDAFKSIVTDRRFCKGDKLRQDSWDLMSQKGVIAKRCVEDIWKKKNYKKFHEHKEYLLGVMTHLDILVEPKRYDNSHKSIPAEFYYVTSMIKTNDTTGYMKSDSFCQRNIAIAFSLPSSMIPPALSFRFLSYCLSMFAVKSYGQKNEEMLFHRSAVFTIDPSLDMCINCDDEIIIVRLVHDKNRTLIMRDLASSIRECLTVALEKISQLYIKTCSTESVVNEGSFSLSLCCSSSEAPCLLPIFKLKEQVCPWICPKHGIEHTKDVMSSWEVQQEGLQCGDACPVTDNAFLEQLPIDIHLRRLSMQYSIIETKKLAMYLGMQFGTWDDMYVTLYEEPERLKFETLRRCIGDSNKTFNDIRNAIELGKIQNQHTLCNVVRGNHIDFDKEPEKWDSIATEEHLDRVAPLVGNNSLSFLVELGMEFKTWEQVKYRQKEKDLVKLNRDILQEWKSEFCVLHQLRPSLRYIGQAFNNIDKNIKIIENVLADLF